MKYKLFPAFNGQCSLYSFSIFVDNNGQNTSKLFQKLPLCLDFNVAMTFGLILGQTRALHSNVSSEMSFWWGAIYGGWNSCGLVFLIRRVPFLAKLMSMGAINVRWFHSFWRSASVRYFRLHYLAISYSLTCRTPICRRCLARRLLIIQTSSILHHKTTKKFV